MEEDQDLIDEQQRFKDIVFSTSIALGGYEEVEQEDGTMTRVYAVGDEALACLKDLKRFLRADNYTTGAILANLNIIERDLIPIIQEYAPQKTEIAERFILACIEVIVPMTWPANNASIENGEIAPEAMDRYRDYKLSLLAPGILEAVLRVIVKPIAKAQDERSLRDPMIIRLALYLIRNLAAVPDLNASQAATDKQLVMSCLQETLFLRLCESHFTEMILMIASSEDTDIADRLVALEIFYYLLEYANPKDVIVDVAQTNENKTNEPSVGSKRLSKLLREEQDQKRIKTKHVPSRHPRFGGTYVVKGWDGNQHVLHKQQAGYADLGQLINAEKKDYRGGKRRKEADTYEVHQTYRIPKALSHLRQTARMFLESCFNVFFQAIIKEMQREDKHITEKDYTRFYFLMRWMLEYLGYEQAAQKSKSVEQLQLPSRDQDTSHDNDDACQFDFSLVANVMEVRVFLMCTRRLRTTLEDKLWLDVQVTADCFRYLLLTVRNMANAPDKEHRDVADFIQSNIYYEQSTFDLFIELIRRYRNQSYGYLKAVVSLTHVLLKLLEQFANSKKMMFVRRKRAHKGQNGSSENQNKDGEVPASSDEEDEDDGEAYERQMAYREHVFRFESFESKYATDEVIRVYCVLLNGYRTLNQDTLHAIISLFHRLLVKRKAEHLFFKLTVLELFHRILTDAPSLPRTPAMNQLVEFIRYCTRQFFKRAQEYPLLFVEVLFKTSRVGLPPMVEVRSADTDKRALSESQSDDDDEEGGSGDSDASDDEDRSKTTDPKASRGEPTIDFERELDLCLAEQKRLEQLALDMADL